VTAIIKQIASITAPTDGNWAVHVIATFESQVTTGGDWGAAVNARVFKTQNSVQTNGQNRPMSTTRVPHTAQGVFALDAGYTITIGLSSVTSGAVACSYWNVDLRYVLVKR
jgi:hypothetical protein